MRHGVWGILSLVFAVTLGVFGPAASAQNDIAIADFEGPDYAGWKVTGEAFGNAPAKGTLPGQMNVSGFRGKALANSYVGGDDTTGSLTSPAFKIERSRINFLIGGGGFANETCIDLLVDGKPVRTATGTNVKQGGSEKLAWQSWDVKEFVGKQAEVRIVDARKGGWGHINVDQIVQSERDYGMSEIVRSMEVKDNYVFVPVKRGAAMQRVEVWAGAKRVRYFDAELTEGQPDLWGEVAVRDFKGQTLEFKVKQPGDSPTTLLDKLTQGATAPDAAGLYQETLRPLFHFSPKKGWTNDPNGLVFFEGTYHLFYQHNPFGCEWGNMHWGHATSTDLLHWRDGDDALCPDDLGTMFSGSAVVDWNNTLGVGARALVCIYTAAGDLAPEPKPFTQGLFTSVDKGLTWQPYPGNPVLPYIVNGNRDPKVLWHEPSKQWIMALFLDGNTYALFGSPNLKEWKRLCDVLVPECGECPDFFELPVENQPGVKKWVFWGANGTYLFGAFDGEKFTAEGGAKKFYSGGNAYAAQSYSDIPKADGRRIQIAWFQQALPGMPFNQMMTFPVQLTLQDGKDGIRLCAAPAKEIGKLHAGTHAWQGREVKADSEWKTPLNGQAFDIEIELAPTDQAVCTLSLFGMALTYDTAKEALSGEKVKAQVPRINGKVALRLLVDRASVELFADNGRVYAPMGHLQDAKASDIAVAAKGGTVLVSSLKVHEIRSALPAAAK